MFTNERTRKITINNGYELCYELETKYTLIKDTSLLVTGRNKHDKKQGSQIVWVLNHRTKYSKFLKMELLYAKGKNTYVVKMEEMTRLYHKHQLWFDDQDIKEKKIKLRYRMGGSWEF